MICIPVQRFKTDFNVNKDFNIVVFLYILPMSHTSLITNPKEHWLRFRRLTLMVELSESLRRQNRINGKSKRDLEELYRKSYDLITD